MLSFLFDPLDFQKKECISRSNKATLFMCTNFSTNQDFCAKEINIYREKEEAISYLSSLNAFCKLDNPFLANICGYSITNFERKPHQMIFTQFYKNGSLENYLRSNENITINQKAFILYGVASAIHYLHSHSIVHGFIHPSNILLDYDLTPKLIINFLKSNTFIKPKKILDDYKGFVKLAYYLLTNDDYQNDENDMMVDELDKLQSEIKDIIQNCYKKNENDEYTFMSFLYIADIIKTTYKIPEIKFKLQKLTQTFEFEYQNIEDIYKQGEFYFYDIPRQTDLSVKYFFSALSQNYHPAICRFAWICLYGVGIKQNIKAALKYYKLAADQGNVEAQLQYAILCHSYNQTHIAEKYYKLAYHQGCIEAAVLFGTLLLDKDKVNEAEKLFVVGVDNGDSDAEYYLAEIKQMENNFAEAFQLYQMSAEKMNPNGQQRLGLMYENGLGCTASSSLAASYAKYSADQELPSGLWYYGYCLENGIGVDKDFEQAAKYYKISAEKNDSFGMWHYGTLLELGRGVEQNLSSAAHFYKLSADLGNEFGQCYYGKMLESGNGVEKNIDEAEKYYKLSAKQINRDGLFHYGRLIEKRGEIEHAAKYFRLAAKQNHPTALYRYGYYLEKVKQDYNNAIKYYFRAMKFQESDAMWSYAMLIDDDAETGKYLKASAELQNSEGQWRYGSYLLSHNDIEGAEKYFQLSANAGNSEGEWRYAYVLEKTGKIDLASSYYKKSSLQNNAKGITNLGFLAENGKIADNYISNYRESALLGNDIGQFNYALQLTKQNDGSVAEDFYKLSAEQMNAPALYNLAKLVENKTPKLAARYMEMSARLGFSKAEVAFGLMLEHGTGIAPDIKQAIKYYESAANKNDPDGQYNFGLILLSSTNFTEAAKMFKKSADQGNPLAALNYACLCEKGIIASRSDNNFETIFKYYEIAADIGKIPEAIFNIGLMYENGKGVTQNYIKAFHYYTVSSSYDIAEAYYNMAVMLENGHGVQKDINKAVKFYHLAAEKQLSNAQYRLYQIYYNGLLGIKCNTEEALKYLKMAANQGNSNALCRYAIILQSKKDDASLQEAAKYYKRAIDAGNVVAKINLAMMIEKGEGPIKKDKILAANLYRSAAEAGNVIGMFNYAVLLEKGDGIEADTETAKFYYNKAAQLGHQESLLRLKELCKL